MTYVLILTPLGHKGHPAIIGGYPTREQAAAAGREATAADSEMFDEAWSRRLFESYAVIPGAADTGPEGAA